MGRQRLRQLLARDDVTCVLCQYVNFALRFEREWRQSKKPLWVQCHGYDVTWDLRLHRWPHLRLHRAGYLDRVRRLAERAMLLANSRFTRQRLMDAGIPAERIRVNYLSVPVPRTPPKSSSAGSRVNILYLGRLVDFKGPDLTLRAFDLACQHGLDGTLTIAGDGPLRGMCDRLRKQSRFGDRIQCLGAVDHRQGRRLRQEADLFTAHNRMGPISGQEEAFGVSIVEAMAAGVPVITGRSGGVVETVLHGETGLLVPPGDVRGHAAALLLLARDLRLRHPMGLAGWRRARDLFSQDRLLGLLSPHLPRETARPAAAA